MGLDLESGYRADRNQEIRFRKKEGAGKNIPQDFLGMAETLMLKILLTSLPVSPLRPDTGPGFEEISPKPNAGATKTLCLVPQAGVITKGKQFVKHRAAEGVQRGQARG